MLAVPVKDEKKLTPLFRQYYELKKEYEGAILLFRLGDFYEMFGPDAEDASRILGITLTARSLNQSTKVPMCGVPHHSVTRYIKRLIEAGRTVAVADQMEDAAEAKGIVARDVTRVITPGTLIEDEFLDEGKGNYLAVACKIKDRIGFAILESSGGTVHAGEEIADNLDTVAAEFESRAPRELKLSPELVNGKAFSRLIAAIPKESVTETGNFPSEPDLEYFAERQFGAPLKALGLNGKTAAMQAIFEVVRTLRYNFKVAELKLTLVPLDLSARMSLDAHTLANLEVLDGMTKGAESLRDVFAKPHTGMGRRMLSDALRSPLRKVAEISARHAAVKSILENRHALSAVTEALAQVADIERIVNRASLGRTNPRELGALRNSIIALRSLAGNADSLSESPDDMFSQIASALRSPASSQERLMSVLADEPPVNPADGGVVRPGVISELDEFRAVVAEGKDWFLRYQETEAERTGIRSLKVKFTGAFGYFIEVSKANVHLVPQEYSRRQTLVNAERYTTPELSEHETLLATADENAKKIEHEVYENLVRDVAADRDVLLLIASAAGLLDLLSCYAETAAAEKWKMPEISDTPGIEIVAGRHPMVERAVGRGRYVANTCALNPDNEQIILLTGPNMGGKSTHMRMVALIALLAHAGSFVPAETARIGALDRIFTRIGASDALAQGQSTFMLEMVETAEILRSATKKSLVVLDEVGRGTGTYDGLSIAKAVVEYLHEDPRARPLTLFATHYFELTELESALPRVVNYKMEVLKEGGEFVFLYAVKRGYADESYGIEVARLAGLPYSVVVRAKKVLSELEDVKQAHLRRAREIIQFGLFDEDSN